jgi:hypothetical protein
MNFDCGLYILDGHEPVKVYTTEIWGRWMETADRHVAQTHTGLFLVSTVFLGLDHGFGKGPPILFESMVFDQGGGMADIGEFNRYSSWDDAEAGHNAIVRRLMKRQAEAAKATAKLGKVKP